MRRSQHFFETSAGRMLADRGGPPALTAIIAATTLGEWPDDVTIAVVLIVVAGIALATGAASGISFKGRELPQQT